MKKSKFLSLLTLCIFVVPIFSCGASEPSNTSEVSSINQPNSNTSTNTSINIQAPNYIQLSDTAIYGPLGQERTIEAFFPASKGSPVEVTFKSRDESVAEILTTTAMSCSILLKGEGSTYIDVTHVSGVTNQCSVLVRAPDPDISNVVTIEQAINENIDKEVSIVAFTPENLPGSVFYDSTGILVNRCRSDSNGKLVGYARQGQYNLYTGKVHYEHGFPQFFPTKEAVALNFYDVSEPPAFPTAFGVNSEYLQSHYSETYNKVMYVSFPAKMIRKGERSYFYPYSNDMSTYDTNLRFLSSLESIPLTAPEGDYFLTGVINDYYIIEPETKYFKLQVDSIKEMKSQIEPTELNVSNENIELLTGQEKKIDVIYSANANYKLKTTFSSSNPSIVSVDENGVLHPYKTGNVEITIKCNGLTKIVNVTTNAGKPLRPKDIILDKEEVIVKADGTLTLNDHVYPSTSNIDNELTYISSDENKATISGNVLTAHEAGNVTITVKTGNNITKTINAIIVPNVTTTGYEDLTFSGSDGIIHNVTSTDDILKVINESIFSHYESALIQFNSEDEMVAFQMIIPKIKQFSLMSTGYFYKYEFDGFETNRIKLRFRISNGVDGKDIATKSAPNKSNDFMKNANLEISKANMNKRSDSFSEFPLVLNNVGTKEVTNSDELYYAIEQGFVPHFSKSGTKAEAFYDEAKSILRNIVSDDMNDTQKSRAIYEYVVSNSFYDWGAYNETINTDSWPMYKCYYLEGFFEDRLAVCNGFAKAISLFCGIEKIPCVRQNGFPEKVFSGEGGTGHSWNLIKGTDERWHLVDATGGIRSIGTLADNDCFSAGSIIDDLWFIDYHSFFNKADLYDEIMDVQFDNKNIRDEIKTYKESEKIDPTIFDYDIISDSNSNFNVDSYEDLLAIFKEMKKNKVFGDLYLTVSYSNYTMTDSIVKKAINEAGLDVCESYSPYRDHDDLTPQYGGATLYYDTSNLPRKTNTIFLHNLQEKG